MKYLEAALHASPPDQPVTVRLTVEDGVVRLSVHDNGVDIPEEEQKRLWERFYQANGDAVQHESGSKPGPGLLSVQGAH